VSASITEATPPMSARAGPATAEWNRTPRAIRASQALVVTGRFTTPHPRPEDLPEPSLALGGHAIGILLLRGRYVRVACLLDGDSLLASRHVIWIVRRLVFGKSNILFNFIEMRGEKTMAAVAKLIRQPAQEILAAFLDLQRCPLGERWR
jgi:hypothetical protein